MYTCMIKSAAPFVQDDHVVTAKVGQDGRRGVKRPHECLDKENVC